MSRPLALLAALAILTGIAPPAFAQHQQGHATEAPAARAAAPYAGLETREIKALSPEQIGDLQAGRGMGLALAAELNGYPGPVHVIELAPRLALSGAQIMAVEELFTAMKAETVPLGQQVIAAEAELDRQFREQSVTPTSLTAATGEIASLQGELRAAHLSYHLRTIEILTPDQVDLYNELRGYAREPSHDAHAN